MSSYFAKFVKVYPKLRHVVSPRTDIVLATL